MTSDQSSKAASRAFRWAHFLFVPALLVVQVGDAYAQRIPVIYLWFAGAGLFAPFVAMPVKLGMLRLLHRNVATSRLWILGAIEWLLWFPLVFVLLRYGSPVGVPFVLPLVLAMTVWLHKESVANTSLRSALLLSLPTPLLAIALPFLAFIAASQFQDYLPKSLL
jgi:hypothetical protein